VELSFIFAFHSSAAFVVRGLTFLRVRKKSAWTCEFQRFFVPPVPIQFPGESPGLFPENARIAEPIYLRHPWNMEIVKTRTKAFLNAQFNPTKTLRQLVNDRTSFRWSIGAALLVVLCL
jgi:hypothetical protein